MRRIIERVEKGVQVIIRRAGKRVAKVVPVPAPAHRTGQIVLTDDWDSPEVSSQLADDFGTRS